MANQKDITLRQGEVTAKDIRLYTLPAPPAAPTTTIYLFAGEATAKDIVLRDPATAPAGGVGYDRSAVLSVVLGAVTASGAGVLPIEGTVGSPLAGATLSAQGALAIQGQAAIALGSLAAAATATVAGGQEDFGGFIFFRGRRRRRQPEVSPRETQRRIQEIVGDALAPRRPAKTVAESPAAPEAVDTPSVDLTEIVAAALPAPPSLVAIPVKRPVLQLTHDNDDEEVILLTLAA